MLAANSGERMSGLRIYGVARQPYPLAFFDFTGTPHTCAN